jgi:hypothetical protein
MNSYTKYRWFYTSKNTLVIGGKNATQNDELLSSILEDKKNRYVLHTSAPGSPFSIVMKEKSKVSNEELKEVAVFTACFSQAWKKGVKKAQVHIFTTDQLSKPKSAHVGTWHVKGTVKKVDAELALVLTRQKDVLRAVPVASAKKILARVTPGKLDKQAAVATIGVFVSVDG